MTKYIPLATGYIVVVSTLYLMGFWNEFNINFLEYIGLTEVAVVALRSLVASFGLMALGAFISVLYLTPLFPPGEGRHTPEGRFLNKWWKLIYLPLVAGAIYAVFTDRQRAMFLLPMIISPVAGIWAANSGIFSNAIKNNSIRFPIVFLAVQIILFANCYGQLEASKRKNPENNYQVLVNGEQYTYLGKLGPNLFLYESDTENTIQLNPIPGKIVYIPNKANSPDAKSRAAD